MRESIKKLLKSNNLDDNKIGLELATAEELFELGDDQVTGSQDLLYFTIDSQPYYFKGKAKSIAKSIYSTLKEVEARNWHPRPEFLDLHKKSKL